MGEVRSVDHIQTVEPDKILVYRKEKQLFFSLIHPVDGKAIGIHCLPGRFFQASCHMPDSGTLQHTLLEKSEVIHHRAVKTVNMNGFLVAGVQLQLHGIAGLPVNHPQVGDQQKGDHEFYHDHRPDKEVSTQTVGRPSAFGGEIPLLQIPLEPAGGKESCGNAAGDDQDGQEKR